MGHIPLAFLTLQALHVSELRLDIVGGPLGVLDILISSIEVVMTEIRSKLFMQRSNHTVQLFILEL